MSAIDDIARAKRLLEDGAITAEEFERLKRLAIDGNDKGNLSKSKSGGTGCGTVIMIVIAVFVAVAVIGAIENVNGGKIASGQPDTRPALEVAIRAKRLLEERLRDPESVRYGTVMAKRGVVCGVFNAKNGFGGYGGDEPFLGLGYPATVVYISSDAGFQSLWDANCLNLTGFIRID